MYRRHLREAVEIVGIVSIVASLLLVAWEVRQANRIAAAEIEMQLTQGFNELNIARAANPELARLFPKLSSPAGHLITATEKSQSQGIAWQMVNLYWAAQIAHNHGVLEDSRLELYRSDVAQMIESYPGLHEHFIGIYREYPEVRQSRVFDPIRDLVDGEAASSDKNQ
jgi:hypothetical protein